MPHCDGLGQPACRPTIGPESMQIPRTVHYPTVARTLPGPETLILLSKLYLHLDISDVAKPGWRTWRLAEQSLIEIHILTNDLGNIVLIFNQCPPAWCQVQAQVHILNRLAELVLNRIRIGVDYRQVSGVVERLKQIWSQIDNDRLTKRPSLQSQHACRADQNLIDDDVGLRINPLCLSMSQAAQ